MEIKLPKEILSLLYKFKQANFQIYIVGGAVRDLLMGRAVKDFDFTTDAKPEEILKLYPQGFYDNKFGTVGIPVQSTKLKVKSQEEARGDGKRGAPMSAHNEVRTSIGAASRQDPEPLQVYEITTMRKEGNYRDHRHPVEVSWTNKIEEDLARRDFTINAIALRVMNGELGEMSPKTKKPITHYPLPITIIDPFNGQADLKNKLIRAVGNPDKRFKEDALRLIRAVRFASELEFDIDNHTLEAIKKNAVLIKEISGERIRDELLKILTSNPYIGVVTLKDVGILQIILPEVEACFGIVQEGPKHDRIYDIGDHLLKTMRETPSLNPITKLAALLHDIGKAKTYQKDQSGNVTFYNHDIEGAGTALVVAKRLHLSKKQTDKLYKLIRWHMFSTDEHQTDSAIRRFIKNVELENLEDMFAIRIGDRLGGDTRRPVSWRMEEFQKRIKKVLKKPFSLRDLKVSGNDVMKVLNIKPSRKVGEVLNQLFKEVLEDASKNNREYLLRRIEEINP